MARPTTKYEETITIVGGQEYLSLRTAAKRCGLTWATLQKYITNGKITARVINDRRHVSPAECDRYNAEKRPRGNPDRMAMKRKRLAKNG